tara:strand:- start:102 stop:206 length:105 start_codon:yes stop_codon:yes gene_type:complete
MKKTNFIKHIESLYELGVIKKDLKALGGKANVPF